MNTDKDDKGRVGRYAHADEDGNFIIPDITKGSPKGAVWQYLKKGLTLTTQVGLRIAICVALGVFFGKLLDSWLGTAPVFIIVLSLLGAGAAFKMIYDGIRS